MTDRCPTHKTPMVQTFRGSIPASLICLKCRYAKNPNTETSRREKERLSRDKDIDRAKNSYHNRRAAGVDTELNRKRRVAGRRAEKAAK